MEPTDTFVVEDIHGDTCPFCESRMHHYGDRTSSGGSCYDCGYSYIDAEPHDDDAMTYEEIKEKA